MLDSSGRERFPYFCTRCGKRTQLFCKKSEVPEVVAHGEVNVKIEQKFGLCERCGKEAHLEQHHWAPWKYFDDADSWPKSMLCRECHEEWHQVMTNDLIKKTLDDAV
jgi:hypothetical protein